MKRLLALGLFSAVLAAPLFVMAAWGEPPDHARSNHGPDGLALDRKQHDKNHPGLAPAALYAVDQHAAWAASGWPFSSTAADVEDLYPAGTKQVHAIYVYPAKAANRFAQFDGMFEADARQANALLATQGKALRFDERKDSAGKRYLDITTFQSRYRANQLTGPNQFDLVANEIAAKFTNPNKKYVVWLDAGSQYCGQGTLYTDDRRDPAVNNNNVARTTAIVYRPYASTDATTGGFCRGRTLLHELGHNLGAVQSRAPHAFDGAHCDDSGEDVMCYTAQAEAKAAASGGTADTGPPVLDYKRDDYWDPDGAELPWWTANLSWYLCPSTTGAC